MVSIYEEKNSKNLLTLTLYLEILVAKLSLEIKKRTQEQ